MKFAVIFMLVMGLFASSGFGNEKNYSIETVKGVKVFKNLAKPSIKGLKIEIRKVFELYGRDQSITDKKQKFYTPYYIDEDIKGSFYILDNKMASVKKYTREGRFIMSFGKLGSGPDEMSGPNVFAVTKDFVYVCDPYETRFLKYDLEGKLLETFKLTQGAPGLIQKLPDNFYVGFLTRDFTVSEKERAEFFNLCIMNEKFELRSLLRQVKVVGIPGPHYWLDRYVPYTVGKNEIYVVENSDTLYRINVFDFSGKLLYAIEKEYTPVLFSEKELDTLNMSLGGRKDSNGQYHKDFSPVVAKYKKTINAVFADKEGRLWVCSSMERNEKNQGEFWVDVFKDGVFLNRVKIAGIEGDDFVKLHVEKLFFIGDRIYYVIPGLSRVIVFEY